MSLFIDHGKVPSLRVVEDLHDLIHRCVDQDLGGSGHHEFIHLEAVVQLRAEHDVADIIQQDNAQQDPSLIDHGKHVACAAGDHLHHVA